MTQLKPAIRGISKWFIFTFGELSCRPSLETIFALASHEMWHCHAVLWRDDEPPPLTLMLMHCLFYCSWCCWVVSLTSLFSPCLPKIRLRAYLKASCSWNLHAAASNKKNQELSINEVSVWSLTSVGGGGGETPSTPMTSEQLSSSFSGASQTPSLTADLRICSINPSIAWLCW